MSRMLVGPSTSALKAEYRVAAAEARLGVARRILQISMATPSSELVGGTWGGSIFQGLRAVRDEHGGQHLGAKYRAVWWESGANMLQQTTQGSPYIFVCGVSSPSQLNSGVLMLLYVTWAQPFFPRGGALVFPSGVTGPVCGVVQSRGGWHRGNAFGWA